MKIHLIGICGTGMASLAGMLKAQGHEVRGSDQNVYPPMSTLLENFKIPVSTPYAVDNLKEKPDLVIIGNVVSRGNVEAEVVLSQNLPYLSMPQALEKFFLPEKIPLIVAGTHGKTTTSSLLAWVLEEAGEDPSFFIGGWPKNFERNFKLGNGKYFVLEGDEYDTAFFDKESKFLHYLPQHILLTSVEFDHADIFSDLEQVKGAFGKLLKLLPQEGNLIANLDFSVVRELIKSFPGHLVTYAMKEENREKADYFGEVMNTSPQLNFCILTREEGKECCHHEVGWGIPGQHNVSNALGVIALLSSLGIPWEKIQKGLKSFQGVRRRQEIIGEAKGILIIDDFAHHPTAVLETIAAIKEKYPDRRLWAVFEPRSNSSKRDIFQNDYPKSFLLADKVLLADVFMPEKVKDGKVLDVEELVHSINQDSKTKARHLPGVEAIVQTLAKEALPGDVILFMSNGGFGGVQKKTLDSLS